MVHSIVPLAVLEAVKNLDTPVEDGLTEFAEELLVKRLGLSPTVEMQLAEYELLARKDARVEPSHVAALLRLVGRRPDADLVFADAGRRAARRAELHWSCAVAAAKNDAKIDAIVSLAKRRGFVYASGEIYGGTKSAWSWAGGLIWVALPAADDYGAGLVELLRLLIGYEGAMLHVDCRARGSDACEWRAVGPDPRHQ